MAHKAEIIINWDPYYSYNSRPEIFVAKIFIAALFLNAKLNVDKRIRV